MEREIKTDRLTLRPPGRSDIPDIVRLIGDFEVAQWLAVVPHPYTSADGHDFLDHLDKSGEPVFAIIAPEGFAGLVGVTDRLGYWLGRSFHGRGYMTEAARAVTDRYFASTSSAQLASGYFDGNRASENVLTKLGFVFTHTDRMYARALGCERTHHNVVLTRKAWEAGHGR